MSDTGAIDIVPLDPGRELAPALVHFAAQGYARLGPVLDPAGAAALATRARALMLGEVHRPGLFYQHDACSGRYEDLAYGEGWIGPSEHYRKLEKLELDPLFRLWIENPLFARIAHALIGPAVSLYRAVLWNKAARAGTELPWHQDDGVFWGIDRAPVLQIRTALDAAPREAGCLEVLPGSHHGGLASPQGGTVQAAALRRADAGARAVALPVAAGEALLIHNHVWHRSGRNATGQPRRALGIAYLHADTRCLRRRRAPRRFERVFVGPAAGAAPSSCQDLAGGAAPGRDGGDAAASHAAALRAPHRRRRAPVSR